MTPITYLDYMARLFGLPAEVRKPRLASLIRAVDLLAASGDAIAGFSNGMTARLAVATSIDALAVGVTLPLLDAPFALSVVTIGVTTALMSVAGLLLGRRAGAALGRGLDVVGGLILIGLGLKILVEHLGAG